MKKFWIFILLLPGLKLVTAQSGGDNTYDFLNLTTSARMVALGGQQISLFDDDLNMVYYNPSLLNKTMTNHLALNYVNYISDINSGYISYARTIKNYGNFGAGIQYVDYGDFQGADVYGDKQGTFYAKDYSFNLYYSRFLIDSVLSVGGALKLINSEYESLNSWGFAFDAGISYINPKNLFSAAFVMKNMGSQLNTYYDGADHEKLPFELQFGISKKLLHAPFRFSILARNLETPNLRYETEADKAQNVDLVTGEPVDEDKLAIFGDNLLRHTVFGLEFVPGKNFYVNLGYNYKRRQELKVDSHPGGIGFSWGFGLKIYKFHISYGHATYHLSSKVNQFSIGINLDDFSKKF